MKTILKMFGFFKTMHPFIEINAKTSCFIQLTAVDVVNSYKVYLKFSIELSQDLPFDM